MNKKRIRSASVRLLPAVLLFSFVLWGFHQVHERPLKGTPAEKRSSRLWAPFIMQGADFHFFLGAGNYSRVRVESVSVRPRRMGDIVFDSFKEVVLHNVRVTARTSRADEAMDWTTDSNLPLLAAPFLVETVQADSFVNFGTHIVAENLKVYLEPADGSGTHLVLSAARMIRSLIPDEILFEGDFQLNRSPSQSLSSHKEARWSMRKGVLEFPEGYYLNGELRSNGSIVLDRCRFEALQTADGSVSDGDAHAGWQGLTFGVDGSSPPLTQGNLRNIHKYLKGKRRKEMISALWELLALHPDALSKTGVAQMILVGPDFKLGAFKPGALFDASSTWMSSPAQRPAGGRPLPAVTGAHIRRNKE